MWGGGRGRCAPLEKHSMKILIETNTVGEVITIFIQDNFDEYLTFLYRRLLKQGETPHKNVLGGN
jgi:hypothetical protein